MKQPILILAAVLLLSCESQYEIRINKAPSAAAASTTSIVPTAVSGCGYVRVSGTVLDATTNNPITGALISFIYNGVAEYSVQSGVWGRYVLNDIKAGSFKVNISKAGYIDYTSPDVHYGSSSCSYESTSALSPVMQQGQIRIVLTWAGESTGVVEDLDSYLKVPGTSTPVYWNNCNMKNASGVASNCTAAGVNLDVDAVNFGGQETITISSQVAGTYIYYIANFSNPTELDALGRSSPIVSVYSGATMIRQYSVPAGMGLGYAVFSLEKGVVKDIGSYLYDGLASSVSTNFCVYTGSEDLKFLTARPPWFGCF